MSARALVTCGHCGSGFLRTQNTNYCSTLCRFVSKATRSGNCWLWTATLDRHGYGSFCMDGRLVGAHRASYMLHRGEIPSGLHIDHLCRTPACVNPWHLEPVTQRENTLRGVAPTSITYHTNRCKRGHEFTPENTIVKLNDPAKRQCRTCQNESRRSRYAEQRSAS